MMLALPPTPPPPTARQEPVPGNRLARFLRAAGRLSATGRQASALARAMGVPLDAPPPAGRSTLNADGAPLQLCVRATPHGIAYRLLGDPAPALVGTARLLACRAAIRAVLYRGGAASLATAVDWTLSSCLPVDDPEALAAQTHGLAWVGGGLGAPGAAVYADPRRGTEEETWERVERWLERLLLHPAAALKLVRALRPHAVLAGVGLEGTGAGHGRAKLYWRLREAVPFARIGVPLLGGYAPWFASFLNILAGDRPIPVDALVFSAGFRLSDGAPCDAKMDVCGCPACLALAPEDWSRAANGCSARFGVGALPAGAALAAGECAGALLGLGVNAAGEPRVNLYLRPAPWSEEIAP